MSLLSIPDSAKKIQEAKEIQAYLQARGIHYERWDISQPLSSDADEKSVLTAYETHLTPYCEKHGYQSVDVICVNEETPNVGEIRKKFLQEHTHTEDEVRFFVRGQGLFWFHLPGEPIFSVLCQEGDLLSVPAHFKHWFDMGDAPYVKVIRMFTDPTGWVAHYTHSRVEERYQGASSWQ
jgi:1,2-dihydroxy-3-keto-5-methylthiopentene dioxygenase